MKKERRCKICGGTGHDARNCPQKNANESHDKIVWFNITDLSDKQADDMTSAVAKAKRKIAPEAHAAFVKADKKSLPQRIADAFKIGKANN